VRAARSQSALLQLATLILAGSAAMFVSSVGRGDGLDDAIRVAPAWLLIALLGAYALAVALTVRIGSTVAQLLEDGARQRRRTAGSAPRSAPRGAQADLPSVLIDELTGLGNHRAFQEELDRKVRALEYDGGRFAVGIIDLDDFQSINDASGHAAGDTVIVEAGRIIRQSLRRGDQVFRIGGDEFGVILEGVRAEEASGVLKRSLADCVQPRIGSVTPRGFSYSAGLSDAPGRALERNDLVAQAEHALAESKRAGRTSIRAYDAFQPGSLAEPVMRRTPGSVVNVLRDGSLTPVYQPIVEVATGRVVGFEGLVRPTSGSGFDDPGSLFAAAEASGRTADLDRLCVETLLAGAGALAPEQTLSINLSPHTLEAPEFSVALLVRMLAEQGFDPARVVFELTERQAVTDMDALRKHLTACRTAGFRIAVDDVGAGNAGLRLLSQLHFDKVKIDLSLVQAGAQRETSLEVLRSLADLAARWGATAVAEGVETPGQLRTVRDMGLAEVQGYLVGAPRPSVELRQVDLQPLMVESNLRASLGFARVPAAPLG
jgi:diguanylate cyclase (GGDEF)-like protein